MGGIVPFSRGDAQLVQNVPYNWPGSVEGKPID